MVYVDQTVTINGLEAELTEFAEFSAAIRLSNTGHRYQRGEPLRFTVFMNVMEKLVPLTLNGEVVHPHNDAIEVMFAPPTHNWSRLLRSLRAHDLLF